MQQEIDTVEHPIVVLTRELLTDTGRSQHNKFLIDDIDNIKQAMKAGIALEAVVVQAGQLEQYQTLICQLPAAVDVYPMRTRTGKKVFGVHKQARLYAIAVQPPVCELSQLSGDLAVLDGVSLSGNIGAIMRSAAAFQVGGVVLLDRTVSEIYDRRLIRASRGVLFHLPVVVATQADLLTYCQQTGVVTVCCSHRAKDETANLATRSERLAWLLGAEKAGVRDQVAWQADCSVRIPFSTECVESLNVSVVAAILFHQRYLAVR